MMEKPQSIELHRSESSERLYIFFGGINARIGMPPFEFFHAAQILDDHKLFLRDFSQSWYQDGLPETGRDCRATAKFLERQIGELSPKRVVFVGNSMGGFAAMLFSCLIGTGDVIAFAPQSFISPHLRWFHRDDRWRKQIRATYRKTIFKRPIFDVKPLLQRPVSGRDVSVYVSRDHRLDLLHAARLRGLPGVRVFELGEGGHALVKHLRDTGRLPAIMAGEA